VISAQQQRPSPQEAEALLKANPELAAQIRDRIQNSGMTPDQIRARLKAEGYPENLLDAYLGPSNAADTSAASPAAVAAALRVLNVEADSADTVAQRGHPDRPWEGATARTAVRCDTVFTSSPKLDTLPLDARVGRAKSIKCTAADGVAVAPPDSGRTIFGLDLFSNGSTQFDANFAGPVDASYKLGPGDQLVLLLTGEVELAHRLDVTREGFVFIPQVGQLHVANLTMQQLNDMLYGVLGRVYPGVRRGADAKTRFSVSVARLRSLQVFVTGDAQHPGSYRVSSAGTALTALYAAGGPTPNGSLRRVEIRRGGKLVETLDVYDYLVRGDATHDPRLESGDVVFVPVRGPTVRLIGEVNRPATYEMRSGETLTDVVRTAGGFRPTAVPSRVQIERIVPARDRHDGGAARVVLDVNTFATRNANGGDSGAGEDTVQVALEDGDVVRVFSIPDRVRNRITVSGNVWQPGSQGFIEHLRLSDAIARAGGVRADTYLGQVLVTRTMPDSTRVQLRAALRADGTAVEDIVLAPDDDIRIFSIPEFRSQRQVAISGAVRKSGRVTYRDGMTLRDLVLLAGGLEDGAYLGEAEIARFPESHAAGATAQMMHVPLDSTYLFATAPGRTPNASQEFVLRPDDQVLILRQPDRLTPRSVVLSGEVKFPGRYALERRDERLRGLLERAGGLTPIADSAGIVFVRTRDGVGRVGINLPNALRNPKAVDDLVLQDGDSVLIPPYSGIVTVSGSVNAPISLAYVPGADVDFYVRAAGGPSRSGDVSHAYVRQASGRVETVRRRPFFPDAVPQPGPGSKVVVPDKPPGGMSAWVQALPVIASIMGSVVAVVAILHK